MDQIFSKNIPTISEAQQKMLTESTVAVIGCGGLGGFVCEYLVRAGVGNVIAVDGDAFNVTNLNRQLLADKTTLGKNKAKAARERALSINPDVNFLAHGIDLSKENGEELLKNADLVIDALDSGEARIMLEKICKDLNLTMIHGAINAQMLHVAVIEPGRDLMKKLFENRSSEPSSTLSFVPGICAGIEVAEAVRILTGEGSELKDQMLIGDLELMTFERIKI